MTALPATLVAPAIRMVERTPLPDALLRRAISTLIETRTRPLQPSAERDKVFAESMKVRAIALHTDDANRQHYELPPEFFGLVLGPHRKYSCCFYESPSSTLAEAESAALEITGRRARLADGQRILELGCGWGSLSLWMAARYPNARITAVSNSHGQRRYIEQTAAARGLGNLTVITADMNRFEPQGSYDRVVSVEMFEHISNWPALLSRVRAALAPDGLMLVHVFSHRTLPYHFDHTDKTDWIAQHFFTGGIMPSDGLMHQFPELFRVVEDWRWSGEHYARTARHWLENYDRSEPQILAILRDVYGGDAKLWQRRWRLFFLATEGLFGHARGEEWGVKHYLLAPAVR